VRGSAIIVQHVITEGRAMTNVGPVGVGIIGAGMISEFYLENLTRFPDTNVLAIADIDLARAQASADKWKLPYAGTTEDLLANPDVEIVLNLTIPAAHASVSTAALEAGKHVWSESRSLSTGNRRDRLLILPSSAGCFSASLRTRCSAAAGKPGCGQSVPALLERRKLP
jgi:hypothetical protein